MKKILKYIIGFAFVLISIGGYSQILVPRSSPAVTVYDSRFYAPLNLFPPHYPDTATANTNKGLDYIGGVIYVYGTGMMYRDTSAGRHKWSQFGTPSSGVITFNGRGSVVVPLVGDYNSFYPVLTGAYTDPSWIASLSASKIASAGNFTAGSSKITFTGTPSGSLLQNVGIDVNQANFALSLIGGALNVSQINATGSYNDSNVLYENGTWGRAGSGGGSSGNTNTNLGTGHRLAVPGTNGIKTLFGRGYVVLDSTSNTNGITFYPDTSAGKLSTKTDLLSYVPSSRTVTINGVTHDLSANNTWAVTYYDSTVMSSVKRLADSMAAVRGLIIPRDTTQFTGGTTVTDVRSSFHQVTLGPLGGTDRHISGSNTNNLYLDSLKLKIDGANYNSPFPLDSTNYKIVVRKTSDSALYVMSWPAFGSSGASLAIGAPFTTNSNRTAILYNDVNNKLVGDSVHLVWDSAKTQLLINNIGSSSTPFLIKDVSAHTIFGIDWNGAAVFLNAANQGAWLKLSVGGSGYSSEFQNILSAASSASIRTYTGSNVPLSVIGQNNQTAHVQDWVDSSGGIPTFLDGHFTLNTRASTSAFPSLIMTYGAQTTTLPNGGFDHYSGHLDFNNNGTIVNLLAPPVALTTGQIGYGISSVLGSSSNFLFDGTSKMTVGPVVFNSNSSNTSIVLTSTASMPSSLSTGNTIIGYDAWNNSGAANGLTALGTGVLHSVTAGANLNTGVGYHALYALTSATNNTAIGPYAGSSLTAGSSNVLFGYQAGFSLAGSIGTSYGNTGIGNNALYAVTSGHQNIEISYSTGQPLFGTSSSRNILIGVDSSTTTNSSLNEATLIGNGFLSARSNMAVFGNNKQVISLGNGGMSTSAYTALSITPAAGDMYWNTDTANYIRYNGSLWLQFGSGSGGGGGSTLATASGDATGTVSGTNLPLTFATVNSNVGTFGDATHVPQYTVNAKGLNTANSSVSIQIAESQVTSLVSDLALKAPIASPTFTGTPAAPTATSGTNTTQIATTAFVTAAITAGAYTLPTATNSVLGGVKPDNVTIANASGVITVAHPSSRPTTTSSSNTTLTLSSGDIVQYIWADPTSTTTAFQVGTTSGGSDIIPTQSLVAGSTNNWSIGYRATGTVTLYFSGITSSTVITLIKLQ